MLDRAAPQGRERERAGPVERELVFLDGAAELDPAQADGEDEQVVGADGSHGRRIVPEPPA